MCEIYSYLTIKRRQLTPLWLLLTLNIFIFLFLLLTLNMYLFTGLDTGAGFADVTLLKFFLKGSFHLKILVLEQFLKFKWVGINRY